MVKPTLSVVLLALAGQARGAERAPSECAGEGRALEVKVGVELAPVCVAFGGSAELEFESPVDGERTEVEGGDVKAYTGRGGRSMALVASSVAAVGAIRRVTVYFADGFEPASATFSVVVVAEGMQRQVKVFRQPRTAASLREEVEDLTQRLKACQSGGGQVPRASAPPGMLPGLLVLSGNDGATLPWRQVGDFVARPGFEGSVVMKLRTLLFPGNGGPPEAAVRIQLVNKTSNGWEVEEATLLSSAGEALARVRTLTPVVIGPRGTAEFDVVSDPTRRAVPGTYTLKLRGRGRELVVDNVTFE